MKRFKILSILIAVFMLGACSNISKGMNYGDDAGGDHNGEPGGGDVVDDSLWPDEIKQEMIDYFGETLPYVELNETTIYSDYDSDYEESGYGHYYVGDDSEVNALADYGDALLEAGYEIVELEGEEFYGKETDKTFLYVSYDYYEATDEYDAGNQIDVFFTISEVEITPEALIENGYEEYQDWPQAEVEEVIAPYTLDLSKVEADGPFYVYCGEDTDIVGDLYPFVSICVEGDYVSELEALLEEEGYQDLEGYYFSEDYMVEISVYSQSGFTVIEICGTYPATLDRLIEEGFKAVNGYPNDLVETALVYSEYFFEGINLTDTWYALLELEESEDGDYYWLGLANENDVSEAFITNLLAAGYYYDEEWECYSPSDDAVEIYISVNDAYTLIEICGPYLGEEPVDLGEETGNVFAKVTSAEQLVDGKYLVVYEEEGMVFNSGLDELDAVENYLEVTITEAGIASTTGLESIALVYDSQAKSLMTADGLYVGHTGSKNTLNTSASPLTNDITFDENGNAKIKSGDYTLQFNNQNGQMRFRYYSSVQQSVQLYLLVEEDL